MSDLRALTPLEKLAIEAAIMVPVRKNRYAVSASVSWKVIEDIRAECERIGIDWRDLHKKTRAIIASARKE